MNPSPLAWWDDEGDNWWPTKRGSDLRLRPAVDQSGERAARSSGEAEPLTRESPVGDGERSERGGK